ncbi:phage tail protein [bacterium]|nr:phage tail protein [bacterium]
MAELIAANDIMFTPFEPKLKNRFIMQIDGIPAYLVKTMARPQITFEDVELHHMNVVRYVKGKGQWQPLTITLYDPIVPSGAQSVMEWVRLSHESVTGRDGYSDFYKKDVTFNVLGPVGDKVEEWTLKGAYINDAQFGDLDFADSTAVEITLQLRYDYAILQF